jgi:hypothetical protein
MTLDNKKAIAEFLRNQLAQIEGEIQKMEALKPTTDEPDQPLTIEIMRNTVAKRSKSTKWTNFVKAAYGVVDNIITILDECYSPYKDYIKTTYPGKDYVSIIGPRHSKAWQMFQLKVIEELLDPNDFDTDYDYEDTAGGCDEVAWDAGLEVIKKLAT